MVFDFLHNQHHRIIRLVHNGAADVVVVFELCFGDRALVGTQYKPSMGQTVDFQLRQYAEV